MKHERGKRQSAPGKRDSVKSEQESGRGGFTLLELLAVMAIMLGLAGLLFGAMGAAKQRARRVKTMNMVKQIADAWTFYQADYGRFPATSVTAMSGSGVLDIMRGQGDNPRGIVYMPLRASTTVVEDAWGNPYRVALDDDYDGTVDVDGTTIRRQVVAWSLGPDGLSGTPDDVASWKEQ